MPHVTPSPSQCTGTERDKCPVAQLETLIKSASPNPWFSRLSPACSPRPRDPALDHSRTRIPARSLAPGVSHDPVPWPNRNWPQLFCCNQRSSKRSVTCSQDWLVPVTESGRRRFLETATIRCTRIERDGHSYNTRMWDGGHAVRQRRLQSTTKLGPSVGQTDIIFTARLTNEGSKLISAKASATSPPRHIHSRV